MLRLLIICSIVLVSKRQFVNSVVTKEEWEMYKRSFGKKYVPKEDEMRLEIFLINLEKIIDHNRQFSAANVSYTLGINQFTDLTHNEARSSVNGYKNGGKHLIGSTYLFDKKSNLPKEVDWRKLGLVTGVKNQGNCLSCWAFSSTGALEGQHKRKTGKLVSLSEQNLVDCSWKEGNTGCSGGLMDYAFAYVKQNGGIDSENSYPYKAKDGNCHFKKGDDSATLTGWVNLPYGDEMGLQHAVATVGPVSVAIDASHTKFLHYRSGILDLPNCSSHRLDHGVLVVGYGSENGQDYWLVKNSYGTTWGDRGYIKMSRNKNNQCGIASNATFPLV